MTTHEILKYGGGGIILIAGILLGVIIERTGVQIRKAKERRRDEARLPRAGVTAKRK
jgi:hypothetical protein